MQEYADSSIQICSPRYTKLSKRAVVKILEALHQEKKIFQRLSSSLLLPADISRGFKVRLEIIVTQRSRIHKYLPSYVTRALSFRDACIYRFIAIVSRANLPVLSEIKNQRSLVPARFEHCPLIDPRCFVTINLGFPAGDTLDARSLPVCSRRTERDGSRVDLATADSRSGRAATKFVRAAFIQSPPTVPALINKSR